MMQEIDLRGAGLWMPESGEDFAEFMAALADMVLPSDRAFDDSPDEGPDCTCSRCGLPIEAGTLALRLTDLLVDQERRYHPACLGIEEA